MKTLLEIVKQTLGELSFTVPSTVVASNDVLVKQTQWIVQSACEELLYAHNWQSLIKHGELTFTGAESYALPDDFLRMIEDSYLVEGVGGWSYSVNGNTAPNDFLKISAPGQTTGYTLNFSIRGGRIFTYPLQATGKLKFAYISKSYVFTQELEFKNEFLQDSDAPMFDGRLVVAMAKAKLLASKGLRNDYAVADYLRILEAVKATDVPAKSIDISCGTTYENYQPQITVLGGDE